MSTIKQVISNQRDMGVDFHQAGRRVTRTASIAKKGCTALKKSWRKGTE
jgi:hypothetical protein